MKLQKHLVVGLTVALLLSGCATTGGAGDSNAEEQYSLVIVEAEKAYKAADSAGSAWRDTKETIEAAKQEAVSNNFSKALALANIALQESKNALQQSEDQKNAGPWLF